MCRATGELDVPNVECADGKRPYVTVCSLTLLTSDCRLPDPYASIPLGPPQGIRSTALVKAALLPGHQQAAEGEEEEQQEEDWAAAARASGAGEPLGQGSQGSTPLALRAARRFPQAWSAVTAHVLHVYKALGAGQDGGEAV